MSLVPNYSSSESEGSDTEQPTVQIIKKRGLSSLLPPPKKTKTIHIEAPKFEDDEEDQPSKSIKTSVGLGLADLLPAPKNYKGPAPVTKTTTAFMPHALAKKLKGKGKAEDTAPEAKQETDNKEDYIVEKEEEEEEIEEEVITKTPKKYTGSFFHLGNKEYKADRF
jgi:hypothetical protein